MKIMVLGDSHGNLPFMQQALQLASQTDCDTLHVVGDFGIWTHIEAGVRFLDEVERAAQVTDVLVTFTDGNHENFDHLYEIPVDDDGWRRVRPSIWHAPRGHIWRWEGVNFMSMGGAHSIDALPEHGGQWEAYGDRTPGKGWWPQETITNEEVKHALNRMVEWVDQYPLTPNIDVLFTHDAPSITTLPPHIGGYPAADENRARLQKVYEVAQPQLLVHGHYHLFQHYHDRYLDSLHISLSHDMAKKGGQYMFIDTDPFEVVIPEWT